VDAGRLTGALTNPGVAVRALIEHSPNAPERRRDRDALHRPHYANHTYDAARSANALGVARGN
jgi:hypothetical protein